jgi:hypothetical protein
LKQVRFSKKKNEADDLTRGVWAESPIQAMFFWVKKKKRSNVCQNSLIFVGTDITF